ncbi:MAG TPA: retropepsin-like aspartic protease, partial [Acidimicrobiales bacterium]|nr:retropepsin-like aspartic protease [Acidimicrobiales bacterium]
IDSTSTGKVPTISVCIDGKGPFTFLLATGAGSSVVSPSLARSLGLHEGPVVPVRGVTCTTSAATVKVKTWSMSGAKLDAQEVLVAKVNGADASPPPSGMIGSDVLSRFAGVRIDYRRSRLVLAGTERAAPKGNVYVLGSTAGTPPSALAKDGAIEKIVPLRIFETAQATIVAVPVSFGGHTEQLALDSGSPDSGLLPSVAAELELERTGARAAISGAGCSGSASTYASGSWALGGSGLARTSLEGRPIAGSLNRGLQGVLGSNVLASDGSVIVDYESAHLWLVTG